MSAKEYLNKVSELKNKILDQEDYVERIRSALGIQAIRFDKEPVQSTPDPHSREHLFIKLNDEEEKLDALKREYESFQVKVIDMIHQLDDIKYKTLLYSRYIDFKPLKDISEEMNYSYDYIRELHKKALIDFENTFPHEFG